MSTELSPDIHLLEQVLQDPAIAALQSDVRTFNEALSKVPNLTTGEINDIVDDLNERWMPLLVNGVLVSGTMHFPKPGSSDPETGEYEVEERFYNDQMIQVDGIVSVDVVRNGAKVNVIALSVLRNREENEKDLEGVLRYSGIAFLEDLQIEPLIMSFERARAWLEYHYPDELVEIETRILNADNECESLLSLKGLSIDLHNDETMDMARQAFSVYLEKMIIFEKSVPYHASIEGKIFIPEDEGHVAAYISEHQSLVYFGGLYLFSEHTDDGRAHIPLIEVALLSKDADKPDSNVIVDVSSLQSVRSIRQLYYYGSQSVE